MKEILKEIVSRKNPEPKFPSYAVERPDFGPTQVRNADEIKPGQILIKHNFGEEKNEKKIMVIRLSRVGDNLLIEGEYIDYLNSAKTICYLSDFGVVPYKSGLWNVFNWLEDPTKIDPTSSSTSEVE